MPASISSKIQDVSDGNAQAMQRGNSAGMPALHWPMGLLGCGHYTVTVDIRSVRIRHRSPKFGEETLMMKSCLLSRENTV